MSEPRTIYLIVGVPGAGKTWVTDQISHKFTFVHHDLYIGQAGPVYVKAIREAAKNADKPLLIEAPFSISQIKDPLEADGHKVIPIFIIEDDETLARRYENREKKPIPKGHLTRQRTYADRAKLGGHFKGTSEEVLKHLQTI